MARRCAARTGTPSLADADLRGTDLTAVDPFHTELTGARIHAEQAVVLAQTLGLRVG